MFERTERHQGCHEGSRRRTLSKSYRGRGSLLQIVRTLPLASRVTREKDKTDMMVVKEVFPGEPLMNSPFNQALKSNVKHPEVVLLHTVHFESL
jgi:hypothetical protein